MRIQKANEPVISQQSDDVPRLRKLETESDMSSLTESAAIVSGIYICLLLYGIVENYAIFQFSTRDIDNRYLHLIITYYLIIFILNVINMSISIIFVVFIRIFYNYLF